MPNKPFKIMTTEDRTLRLRADQIKAIYQQATMTALNSWVTGLIVIFIPNPATSTSILALWFLALTLSCALRLVLAHQFKKREIKLEDHTRWGYAYAAVIFITALVWSSAPFLLASPNHLEYEMLFLVILVAMCIGASHASTTYLLAGQAYTVPAMSIVVIFCLYKGTPMFYGLAILAALYGIMMNVVGRDSNQRFLEIQRLRYELAEKKDEAEKANIAKSKFLAAASHDLRQPLHALTLFTTALKEKVKQSELLRIVNNIDNSVEALQGLFNSLLDISKLDAGSMQVEREIVSLQKVLTPLANEFAAEAEKKNIKLICKDVAYYVHTDAALLSRIIRNLVSNALRYTESGTVTIKTEAKGNALILSVIDTGCGIPEDKQKDIFNEYVQLHNPERDREKGLGLGLAIVQRLVNLLDLNISVESAPHRGSQFSITLPLANAPSHIGEPERTYQTDGDNTASRLNVLIIDDEESVREGALTLLETWHYKAAAFADADACQTFLANEDFQPDVLLADFRLRGNKTGIQAIKQINGFLGRELPAAIITGDTAAERLREIEDSGYLVMHKPFKPMQLRAFLNHSKQALSEESD